MSHEEMPIFSRSFDLLTWLLPVTNHFPRAHRFSITRRLLDAAFDFREHIEAANLRQGAPRRERLTRADEALARLRVYLRLAGRWGWLTDGSTATPRSWWPKSAAFWVVGRRRRMLEAIPGPRGPVSQGRARRHPVCCGAALTTTILRTCVARRRLRAAVEAFEAAELPAAHLAAAVHGWFAHARYGNTAGLRQAVLGSIPAEIRAMIEPSAPT